MYHIKLSTREHKRIKDLQKKEKSVRVLRRLQAIELLHNGTSHKEVAELLTVCIDTVTDWMKLYEAEGIKGLSTLSFKGKRTSKIDAYLKKIEKDIQDNTLGTLAEVQDLIKKKYDLSVEQSWLYRCLKKNSISLTKRLA